MTASQIPREKIYVHRLFVRVFHWVNALGMALMIMSGWLGGALQWHFAPCGCW